MFDCELNDYLGEPYTFEDLTDIIAEELTALEEREGNNNNDD